MKKTVDFSGASLRESWMHHPTFGDPSFDTFELHGDPIHVSTPPYDWAVNGSLFRDPKTGFWYCFVGIYLYGYKTDPERRSNFLIYESKDEGAHWENKGHAFDAGFTFEGSSESADSCPDVVMEYDAQTDIYWLIYDGGTNNATWEFAHSQIPPHWDMDSGCAIAWAKHPLGPFTRLPHLSFSNKESFKVLGKFDRGYASTLIKRENDWIMFTLFDSYKHFAWSFACMLADHPEGPWSAPNVILSGEGGKYYPAPIEFHPAFTHEGKVYAPATSIAKNRNYQAVFCADLEKAHMPSAWSMQWDGSWWHSRPRDEEYYGIWGQTNHGFVHEGMLYVMFPTKNQDDKGVISIARRKWDEPYSDGFVLSGHAAPSISPLYAAYSDFALQMKMSFTGTMELLFDYAGLLGPDIHCSDASCGPLTLSNAYSLRLEEAGRCQLLRYNEQGEEEILWQSNAQTPITALSLEQQSGRTAISINGTLSAELDTPIAQSRPLALVAGSSSIINVSQFRVEGSPQPYTLRLSGLEGLLAGGQHTDWWQIETDSQFLYGKGYTCDLGGKRGKWNFVGNGFTVYAPCGPDYDSMEVWLDGYYLSNIRLHAEELQPSKALYTFTGMEMGKHALEIRTAEGKAVIDTIEIHGAPITEA